MVTMPMLMLMSKKKHRKPLMDQCRMWWTEGIVGDVDGYECNDADVDKEESALKAEDGSTQNVED
jgi:hypothetical protein